MANDFDKSFMFLEMDMDLHELIYKCLRPCVVQN